jgi:diguanylate cyclase (GGDEF)-like protein
VDDDRFVLSTLMAALQGEFKVLTASSGDEAMEHFRRQPVDLVLCDQKMPGMSGVEFLVWVRETYPKTLRLLMTGYAELEDAVEAINRCRVYQYLFKPWRVDELHAILKDGARTCILERSHEKLLEENARLIAELEGRVQQRTSELEDANRQLHQSNAMLQKLALTDELTSLPNRRAIEQILLTEARRRSRYPSPMAVGLIDADHFRNVNTRYLHPGGDQVLKALARSLGQAIRATDTVGRWGGEEFMVVAPITNYDGSWALAERIRTSVEEMIVHYQEHEIRVTISVGFVVIESEQMPPVEQMVHDAAQALREAKAGGRNRSVLRMCEHSSLLEMAQDASGY